MEIKFKRIKAVLKYKPVEKSRSIEEQEALILRLAQVGYPIDELKCAEKFQSRDLKSSIKLRASNLFRKKKT